MASSSRPTHQTLEQAKDDTIADRKRQLQVIRDETGNAEKDLGAGTIQKSEAEYVALKATLQQSDAGKVPGKDTIQKTEATKVAKETTSQNSDAESSTGNGTFQKSDAEEATKEVSSQSRMPRKFPR